VDCKAYVELRKKELDGFLATWEAGKLRDPENYPEHLDEPEWYEQEICHNETNGKELP
jgi:hypothetical protein